MPSQFLKNVEHAVLSMLKPLRSRLRQTNHVRSTEVQTYEDLFVVRNRTLDQNSHGPSCLIALVIGICILFASAPVRSQSSEFEAGNQFYKDKLYDSAIVEYNTLLETGVRSPALLFNLGNAYFKQGDLGRAILNYIRARRLDPNDNDINGNLEFARQFTSVQMEGVELNPISSALESVVGEYRLEVLAWISSGCFLLLLGILMIRLGIGMNNSLLRVALMTSLILVATSAFLTTFKYRSEYVTRRAVIVEDESPVFTGPTDDSDIELQGAPGLVVEVLAESGEYFNVLFENKRRGWIKKVLVSVI